MLQYLNGIGAPRRRSGGGGGGGRSAAKPKAAAKAARKATRKAERAQAKNIVRATIKAAPKNPRQAIIMANKVAKRAKLSPMNAIRLKKAAAQAARRKQFEEQGEPIMMDDPAPIPAAIEEPAEIQEEQGQDEVVNDEFDQSQESQESGAEAIEEMAEVNGVYYPVAQAAFAGKQRKAKKAAKTEKKKATAELRKAKGQAKIERAKSGAGKAAALLNKGLDTAGKFLEKKSAAPEKEEKEEKTFMQKYGLTLGLAGAGLAAVLILPKLVRN